MVNFQNNLKTKLKLDYDDKLIRHPISFYWLLTTIQLGVGCATTTHY